MPEFHIAVLPGDGIGPEVTAVAVAALRRLGEDSASTFRFVEAPIGFAAVRASGDPLPPATLDLCLSSHAVLLGAVGDPRADALPAAQRPEAGLLRLRQALGCFANLRPVRVAPALEHATPFRPDVVHGVDLLIVRELLGGLYFGEPRGRTADRAVDTLVYTEPEVERIARLAFRCAAARRGSLISVDKANVLHTSRLWRDVVTRVAAEFPSVHLTHQYVDSFALALNLRPRDFDVILTENTFGDILSDQAASLCGSLGLLPSASLGGRIPLFEPIHGSAPHLAGRNVANPIGAVRTAAMLLRHAAAMPQEADWLDEAVDATLAAGHLTPDLATQSSQALGTVQCGAAILDELERLLAIRRAYHAV